MNAYENLMKLGYSLPGLPPLAGLYVRLKRIDRMVYVSGQGCTLEGRPVFTGKVGADLSMEEGQEAARICALNALAILDDSLGSLDKVKNVVKVLGFVASAPGFNSQPAVVNGCSQLLIDVFGEAGRHARSAIGVSELPGDIPVEIEFIFEVE
jgi:enamine deaminase RidA (YjgF/YER057c/UK114 family)